MARCDLLTQEYPLSLLLQLLGSEFDPVAEHMVFKVLQRRIMLLYAVGLPGRRNDRTHGKVSWPLRCSLLIGMRLCQSTLYRVVAVRDLTLNHRRPVIDP